MKLTSLRDFQGFEAWRCSHDEKSLTKLLRVYFDVTTAEDIFHFVDAYFEATERHRDSDFDRQTNLHKLLKRNFRLPENIRNMERVQLHLPSVHPTNLGKCNGASFGLETEATLFMPYYYPAGIDKSHRPAATRITPFIFSKHRLRAPGQRDASVSTTENVPPPGQTPIGPPQAALSRPSNGGRRSFSTFSTQHSLDQYQSKLINLGKIYREEEIEPGEYKEQLTTYAAVAQVEDSGYISGIFAVPFNLEDLDEDDFPDPEDMWSPEVDGVYYLGKNLEDCRHREWTLCFETKRFEVIRRPEVDKAAPLPPLDMSIPA